MAKSKGTKGKSALSAEAIEKSRRSRAADTALNDFIACQGTSVSAKQVARIAELEGVLESGIKIRQVPVFSDKLDGKGRRMRAVGADGKAVTEPRECEIKPAERLRMQLEIQRLRAGSKPRKFDEKRAALVEAIPVLVGKGYTPEMLHSTGVPVELLTEAGYGPDSVAENAE